MSKVTNFQTRTMTELGSYIHYAYLNLPYALARGPVGLGGVLLRKINGVIAMVVGVLVCFRWWSTW